MENIAYSDVEGEPLQRSRRHRASGVQLARAELNAPPARDDVLADCGLPPTLSNDSADSEDVEDTARRETRSKIRNDKGLNEENVNEERWKRVFGSDSDDVIVLGQERLPRDGTTADSSDHGEDEDDKDEEKATVGDESDGDGGNDNINLDAINLGGDVVEATTEQSWSLSEKGKYAS